MARDVKVEGFLNLHTSQRTPLEGNAPSHLASGACSVMNFITLGSDTLVYNPGVFCQQDNQDSQHETIYQTKHTGAKSVVFTSDEHHRVTALPYVAIDHQPFVVYTPRKCSPRGCDTKLQGIQKEENDRVSNFDEGTPRHRAFRLNEADSFCHPQFLTKK